MMRKSFKEWCDTEVMDAQPAKTAAEEAAAARKASEDAAAEHARYLTRYLTAGISRKQGVQTVAILTVSEDGKLDRAVTTALTSRFKNEPVEIVSSFFKPAFVADGLFLEAWNGSGEPFQKLDLANALDGAVLAHLDVQYTKNAALENVITATMQLSVAVMPVSGQGTGNTWTFTAAGPGFTKEVARQAAEERLIKQIATDIKMSLASITSNH